MRQFLVFALGLTLSATWVWADMYSDCDQTTDPDRRIRGCTQVIERGKGESRKNRSTAHYNRAIAFGEKGEYGPAIADFTKTVEIDPKFSNAYCNRGIVYARKDEFDSAIADFNKAIALDPKSANAYYHRGIVYLAKPDKEKAMVDLRKALEIDPSFKGAKFLLDLLPHLFKQD